MRLRFTRASLLLFLSCCVAVCCAESIYAVKDGQVTAAAQLTAPQRWRAGEDGALVGGGIGHMLCVKQPFAPEGLAIDAELALEKLEGTAVSLIIGNGNLGLDGGAERLPFFERIDQPGSVSQTLETAFRITPGEFFHLHVECSDGWLVATADGLPLAEVPFKPDGSVTVALRPQRNTMHVKSLAVMGIPLPVRDTLVAERLNQKFNTVPVALEIVSCQDGGTVTLKSESLPAPGTYSCTIAPENPEGLGKAIPFRAELDNFGQLRIPAEVAQAIYSTSAIKFNLRPARLEVRDANSTLLVSNRLLLSNPMATTDYPQGEVRMTAGQPEFWVDNEPTGTVSGRLDRAYGVHESRVAQSASSRRREFTTTC